MSLQFLGLIIALFGAGCSKPELLTVQNNTGIFPTSLTLNAPGHPTSPPLRVAHRRGPGASMEYISAPGGTGKQAEPVLWVV